ncbi:MAG: hypothetical protein LBD81_00730 [Holosporaceae bacterium]|jgi:hypothetical protein|nr:hypothetical protein [Holosporaceae bacterium]
MRKILCFICGALLFEAHGMSLDEYITESEINRDEQINKLEYARENPEEMEKKKIAENKLKKKYIMLFEKNRFVKFCEIEDEFEEFSKNKK